MKCIAGSLRRCGRESRRIDRAGRRSEFRAVRFLPEIGRCDERLREVFRVLDDRGHGEPLQIARTGMAVVILRDDRVLAIRYAVGPQIAGAHSGRHDLQVAAGNTPTTTAAKAEPTYRLLLAPFGDRRTLPRPIT